MPRLPKSAAGGKSAVPPLSEQLPCQFSPVAFSRAALFRRSGGNPLRRLVLFPAYRGGGSRGGAGLLLPDWQLSAVVHRRSGLSDAGAGGAEAPGAAKKRDLPDLSLPRSGAWLAAACPCADGGNGASAALQPALAGAAGRVAALFHGGAGRAAGY